MEEVSNRVTTREYELNGVVYKQRWNGNCCYCDKPTGNPVKVYSYWSSSPMNSCQDCKDVGKKSEALECQLIDANCNDCKHFDRDAHNKRGNVWRGHCKKFHVEVKACPNFSSGYKCFEHRLAKP